MYHESKMGGGNRYFNLKRHTMHDDGWLTIKASGYEDCRHWTGSLAVAPTEADYDFWYWLARVKQAPGIIAERDLAWWKSEYAASREEGETSGVVNAPSGQHPLGEEKEE